MSHDSDRDLSKLYRAGACEEPPASLDRHIVNAARQRDGIPIWHRFLRACTGWQIGFGAFAVVVLSVSLIAIMHDQSPLTPEADAPPMAVPAPASSATAIAPRTQSEELEKPAPAIREEQRPTQNAEVAADRTSSSARREEVERRSRPAESPSDALVREPSMERPSASVPGSEQAVSQGQPAMEVPTSPAAAVPVAPEIPRSPDLSSAPGGSQAAPSAAPRITQAAPKRSDAVTSKATSTESPDAWLGRIDTLFRAGREEEAVMEMGRFLSRFPSYPVPTPLKPLVDASNRRAREPSLGKQPSLD